MTTKKSIIRKGPSGGKKSNDFIAVKEDEPVTVVPVLPTGEIVSIDLHAFWAVNPAVTFACIKDTDDAGDGCPGCMLDDKAGYRAFLPVLDGEGELKVFPFGISVERQLVTLEDELGSIVGKKLRIRRTGTGLSTKYQVINTGRDVSVSVKAKSAADFVESKIEIKDRDKIMEELEAAGLWTLDGKKKKKSKPVDEEDDDETEDEDLDEEDDDETEDDTDETDDEETDDEEEDEKPVRSKVKAKPSKAPAKKVAKPAPKTKVIEKKKSRKVADDDWE